MKLLRRTDNCVAGTLIGLTCLVAFHGEQTSGVDDSPVGSNRHSESTGRLRGTVRSAEGQPVAGARVWVNACEGAQVKRGFGMIGGAATDQHGSFAIALRWKGESNLTIKDVR